MSGSRDATVLLWKIHRAYGSGSSTIQDPTATSGTPPTPSSSLVNILADKTRRRRIEGPIHVLRGHHREISCCCISSDLGIVVSCSNSSDVLVHSVRRGRLIRRLAGVEAHAVCLSSDGILLTWNKSQHMLRTFTLNGIPVASAKLPASCSVSCMEISADCRNALVGLNSSMENSKFTNGIGDFNSNSSTLEENDPQSAETDQILAVSSPSISFMDLHNLKVQKLPI